MDAEKKNIAWVAGILFLLMATEAMGTTYYVDKNSIGGICSDSNPGTIVQPWCSIKYAANTLVAGDTVNIRQGTYSETDIYPSRSGTSGNYITYKVYQNENVTIDATGADDSAFYIYNLDYIKIDGSGLDNQIHLYFEKGDWVIMLRASDYVWVTHVDVSGSPYNDGLKLTSDHQGGQGDDDSGSKHCIIEYSSFHDNGDYGIKLTGYGTSYNTIRYNNFYSNGATGSDKYGMQISGGEYEDNQPQHNELYGNKFYNNLGCGIHLYESSNNILRENEFYNNGIGTSNPARGISLSLNSKNNLVYGNRVYNNNYYGIECSSHADSNKIYNNIIYDNAEEGIMIQGGSSKNEIYSNTISGGTNGGIYLSSDTQDTIIKDNIVLTMGTQPTLHNGGGGTATLDYNLWYDSVTPDLIYWNGVFRTLSQFYADTGNEQHGLQTNPLFIDLASHDFYIQAGSPAINNGISLSAYFSTDFAGTIRPQGSAWDIGAYEYVSGTGAVCGAADNNPSDGVVSGGELVDFISGWKQGDVTISDLIAAIAEWKNGC